MTLWAEVEGMWVAIDRGCAEAIGAVAEIATALGIVSVSWGKITVAFVGVVDAVGVAAVDVVRAGGVTIVLQAEAVGIEAASANLTCVAAAQNARMLAVRLGVWVWRRRDEHVWEWYDHSILVLWFSWCWCWIESLSS